LNTIDNFVFKSNYASIVNKKLLYNS